MNSESQNNNNNTQSINLEDYLTKIEEDITHCVLRMPEYDITIPAQPKITLAETKKLFRNARRRWDEMDEDGRELKTTNLRCAIMFRVLKIISGGRKYEPNLIPDPEYPNSFRVIGSGIGNFVQDHWFLIYFKKLMELLPLFEDSFSEYVLFSLSMNQEAADISHVRMLLEQPNSYAVVETIPESGATEIAQQFENLKLDEKYKRKYKSRKIYKNINPIRQNQPISEELLRDTPMRTITTKVDLDGDVKQLARERRKMYDVAKKEAKEETDRLRAFANQNEALDINFLATREEKRRLRVAKQHNREGYAKRIQDRIMKRSIANPENDLSFRARHAIRIKKHFCSCGLKENTIVYGEKITFSCNHRSSPAVNTIVMKCDRCGSNNQRTVRKAPCGCHFAVCSSCKITNYFYNRTQYFDKHIAPNYLIKIEDNKEFMYKKNLPVATVYQPSEVTTSFAEKMNDKKIEEKPKSKKIEEVRSKFLSLGKSRYVRRNPIETIPEGGAFSAATAPVVGAVSGVKEHIGDFLTKLKDQMSKLTESLGKINLLTEFIKEKIRMILTTFEMLGYLILEINPVTLGDIILALKDMNWTSLIFHLGAAYLDLLRAEELARAKVKIALATDKLVSNVGLYTPLVRNREGKNLKTCLTELQNTHLFGPNMLESIREMVQGTTFTEPESGFSTFLEGICGFFHRIPAYFGSFASIKFLLIDLKPYLLGIKSWADITRIASNLTRAVTNFVLGSHIDDKAWIAAEKSDPESPIHKLVANYLAYQMETLGDRKDVSKGNETRMEFYRQLTAAEIYVSDAGRLSATWFQFRNGMENAMRSPPAPTPRQFEPTVLVLSGSSGVGKSSIWKAILAHELLTEEEMKKDNVLDIIERKSHTWNVASEFQKGMADKRVILFDDFGQARETSTEAEAVIQLCTTASFPINTPDIQGPEIKGMCASPDFVVMCTNLSHNMAAAKLASTDALKRRYDIEFEVLERFNPVEPGKRIFKVLSCAAYSRLIGKLVSFEEARTLFSVIHRKKRAQFTAVKQMVTEATVKDIKAALNIPFTSGVSTMAKSNVWQADGDVIGDIKFYLEEGHSGVQNPFETYARTTETVPEAGIDYYRFASNYLVSGFTYGFPLAFCYVILSSVASLTSNIGEGIAHAVTANYRARITIKSIVKIVLASASMFATACLIYHRMKNTPESGGTRTAKHHTQKAAVPIDSIRENGESYLNNIIKAATGTLRIVGVGTTTNCVFPAGHFVLFPRHFIYKPDTGLIADGTQISIVKSTWATVSYFPFEKSRLVPIKGNIYSDIDDYNERDDLILYRLDKRFFKAEKEIIHHFWKGDHSIENFTVTKFDYLAYNSDGSLKHEFATSSGRVIDENARTARKEGQTVFYHTMGVTTCDSRQASCGSMYRLEREKECIVGVHIARTSDAKACIHYITQDALRESMKAQTVLDIERNFIVKTIPEANQKFLPEDCLLNFEGTVDKPVYQPTKTTLRPSLAFRFDGDNITEPAVLRSNDERLPSEFRGLNFYKQLFKGYKMSFGAFQKEDLHLAYQSLKDHAEEHIAKEPWPKNFDRSIDQEMRDCLNGYPYLADNTRMDMSTSPGYPYVGEGLSKKALFEDVEGTIIPGPRISHDYQHASHLLKRGVVPFLPYTLTLKDERVKKAKIYDVPKTRIFGCANVVHFMLMRKYFHKFLMTYYHLPIKHNFCAPSLDRLSAQWNDLVVEMIKPGTNGFDFDFEHWDRSMQKIMLHYATHIMLVGQDLPYIEKAAIVEMISAPYMIWGDHVYRSSGVLMSGALTTFMMNCLINEMIHRAAWIHLTRQIPHTVGTIYSYEKLTRGMRAGDDTITVVNPAVEEVFNGSTVAEYLRSKGMRVTDGRKNPVVAKLTPFMEMVFLKNVTQRRYGLFLPLPALADLKESCNWLRVNAEIKREMTLGNNTVLQTATNDNCTAALRAIFFHGRSIYEDVYNKLKKAFPEIKIPRYQELFSIWTTHNKFPGAHPDFATDIAPETAFAEV